MPFDSIQRWEASAAHSCYWCFACNQIAAKHLHWQSKSKPKVIMISHRIRTFDFPFVWQYDCTTSVYICVLWYCMKLSYRWLHFSYFICALTFKRFNSLEKIYLSLQSDLKWMHTVRAVLGLLRNKCAATTTKANSNVFDDDDDVVFCAEHTCVSQHLLHSTKNLRARATHHRFYSCFSYFFIARLFLWLVRYRSAGNTLMWVVENAAYGTERNESFSAFTENMKKLIHTLFAQIAHRNYWTRSLDVWYTFANGCMGWHFCISLTSVGNSQPDDEFFEGE